MSATLINSSGYAFGIAVDEVGIKAASFILRCEPEYRVFRHGLQDDIEGIAVGPVQRNLTITGDVNNTTGVMAIIPTTAFVPAGDVTEFGGSTGGFYMVSAEKSQERGSWVNVSVELQSNAGVP